MASLKAVLLVFVIAGSGLLASCETIFQQQSPPPPTPNPEPISKQQAAAELHKKMPEQTVGKLLGTPNKSRVETCGGYRSRRWNCLSWIYLLPEGAETRRLVIYFEKSGNQWIVNSWDWYEY